MAWRAVKVPPPREHPSAAGAVVVPVAMRRVVVAMRRVVVVMRRVVVVAARAVVEAAPKVAELGAGYCGVAWPASPRDDEGNTVGR